MACGKPIISSAGLKLLGQNGHVLVEAKHSWGRLQNLLSGVVLLFHEVVRGANVLYAMTC